MSNKATLLKGTRDFGANQIQKREFIFGHIRKVFQKYGFGPLETPAMESMNTLTGKYGEEGDRLLFKVLNNGDFLAKADQEALNTKDSKKVLPSIVKRGMRYDLTVPFARYVVMNQQTLKFPYKRYQIQPVWRADRPQKGRYQEFYQCDADAIGSKGLIYEAELMQIYDEVFVNLGLNVCIRINNRKILFGIAENAGVQDKFMDMTIILDKLDKIGEEKVRMELGNKGISESSIDIIMQGIAITELDELKDYFKNSETGILGYQEVKQVFDFLLDSPLTNELKFDISLARGLGYYTGCIFEVESKDAKMGSIGGGGRYDDLTGVFGLKNLSGVGISFGAERIYDVMNDLFLFPNDLSGQPSLLILSLDASILSHSFQFVTELRKNGIHCDMYPEAVKMKKQMAYADARQYESVIIIGEEEVNSKLYTVKQLLSGKQEKLSKKEILTKFIDK